MRAKARTRPRARAWRHDYMAMAPEARGLRADDAGEDHSPGPRRQGAGPIAGRWSRDPAKGGDGVVPDPARSWDHPGRMVAHPGDGTPLPNLLVERGWPTGEGRAAVEVLAAGKLR